MKFQTNDYVFYGAGGVCRIEDVQTAPLDGMPEGREYYVLKSLHESNGVMYIPVDHDGIFLRPLIRREEAEALLDRIAEIKGFDEPNAKRLRECYVESMRKHEPAEWIRVLKTVARRMRELTHPPRRLSDAERGFGESAKRDLCAELSLVLGVTRAEIEDRVNRALHPEET